MERITGLIAKKEKKERVPLTGVVGGGKRRLMESISLKASFRYALPSERVGGRRPEIKFEGQESF